MHILIDIGNSTVVIALADSQGDITATWRFKTKKEEISVKANEVVLLSKSLQVLPEK